MAQVTISTEADVATWASGIAAGLGQHLPIGYWQSAVYRSAMRFPKPAWGTWTKVTKAVLEFSISDHSHVGVRNSGIYIRQQSSGATLWTKAEGTTNCETTFSAGNTTQYDDLVPTTANQVSFSSGTTANARKSIVVTAMVQSYFSVDRAKLVFIFDPMDSNDYTELWSRTGISNTYDAKLIIDYETDAPPAAPTLLGPLSGSTIEDQTPTFSWNHNDPNPQSQADLEVYANDGVTLVASQSVMGTAETLDLTTTLTRGQTYKWRMRTWDAVSGAGAWYSTLLSFTVRALPVVTISATRKMVFAGGAPRLAVDWTSDQPQTHYRVQSSAGYDSGWVAGSDVTHVLATQAVVSGTAQTITVSSRSSYGALEGSASRAFTPRYGLTTHRKDLTTAPLNWGVPVVTPGSQPADTQLVLEYGSDTAANAVPVSGWQSSLSSVPVARYLYYRAWFIPSATTGPTLDKLVIPTDATVTLLDKWGTTRDVAALTGVWAVDPGEAVYGTRSLRANVTGAGPFTVYSFAVQLRAGRSYILTGLMKSLGNSGAQFRLEDSAGTVLLGGVVGGLPAGNIESPTLVATQDWFNANRNDTVRYRTPVYVAASDMTAYVALRAGGTSGAKAWFDAIKLEESTVATPWSPAAIGATVIDAGGVQVDGTRGGILRYKGSLGTARAVVEGGSTGLLFAGDTELTSPSDGNLAVDGALLAKLTDIPAPSSPNVPGGVYAGPNKTAIATTAVLCPLTNGGRIAGGLYVVGAGEAGLYYVQAYTVITALGGAAHWRSFIYKNGASIGTGVGGWTAVGATGAYAEAFGLVDLAVGDTIGIYTNGSSGTSAGAVNPFLNIYRIAPAFA
jgi:hypothetical protein